MNKKKLFTIFSIIILTVGLVAVLYAVRQKQILTNQAAPATSLSVGPFASETSYQVGESFDVPIRIETNENVVVATELYISFDKNVLSANSLTMGSIWPTGTMEQTKQINNEDGRLSYILIIPTSGTPFGPDAQGVVATINFTAIGAGIADIAFLPNTLVAGVGPDVGTNVLQIANSGTITVTDDTSGSCQCDQWNVTNDQCGGGTIALCTGSLSCQCATPGSSPGWCGDTCSNNGNCQNGMICNQTNFTCEGLMCALPTATTAPTATTRPTSTVTATTAPTATVSPTSGATATISPTSGATATVSPTSGGGGNNPTATTAPTPTSGGSGNNAIALAITSIREGQVLTDSTPTIAGTAPASSSVSLVVNSNQNITGTVTSNSSGNWSWTSPTVLHEGSHKVTATAQGNSVSVNFSVNTLGTSTALPDAGVSYPTIFGLTLGTIVILVSTLFLF